jgi:hypothetical protein
VDLQTFLGSPIREEELSTTTPLLSDYLPHLSASSIGMLMRCPRQFQHRYLFGEKERPGEGLFVGSSFHDVLEWNYAQKIESHTDHPITEAIEYLNDVSIPKVIEESGGEDWISWDTDKEKARADTERITSAYYRTVVPRIQPSSVEEKFAIQFDGVEVPVIGYLDLQDEDRILDTKTGKQAARKVKPSWQLQGRLYSFAKQKPTEFHSISRAQTPTIVTALESTEMTVPPPTPGQQQEMTRLVQTAAELIRYFLGRYGTEEEWPTWGAIPDWSRNVLPCQMCGWRQGCPAWA